MLITNVGIALVMVALLNWDSAYAQGETEQGTRGLDWSPYHQFLAVTNINGELQIVNQLGETVSAIQASVGALYAVAWSPNGALVATGGSEAEIRLWNATDGSLGQSIPVQIDGVTVLAWQPNGTVLLVAGIDTFQAWNTSDWTAETEPLSVSLLNIRWSPDGTRFAVAGTPRNIAVATLTDGELEVTSFLGHTSYPYSVAWNTNGDRLISAGGLDGSVRLWDANTGAQLAVLLQTDQTVTDAVFVDAAGTQIVAITDEGTAFLVDVLTTQVLEEHTFDASLWRAAWNPQSNLLAISGKSNEGSGETSFLNISLPNFELPPTPTPSPTPTPTATPTPAAFQRLRVTAICSDDPATSRRWRIRNPNSYPVPFTWEMRNSPSGQQGTGTAPVAVNGVPSAVILTTVTERWIPIIEVTANTRSDFAINLGIPCDWPSWLEP